MTDQPGYMSPPVPRSGAWPVVAFNSDWSVDYPPLAEARTNVLVFTAGDFGMTQGLKPFISSFSFARARTTSFLLICRGTPLTKVLEAGQRGHQN